MAIDTIGELSLGESFRTLESGGFRDTTDVVRKNIQFAEDSLKRYQKLVEKHLENPPPTLFTKLFKGEEEEILAMKEIRDEAKIYILAGSDTTALTLTYLVWAVCRDSAIRVRLAGELANLPAGFGDAELRHLPYLNQVIDESLPLTVGDTDEGHEGRFHALGRRFSR
ncbi:hypothetical protein Daus18300_010244 [Diaporthe australafricana]|uniref:Cytochrome P450 n=1 Tax=Diaporthe australafricana TaxID=127596 RepID=A0ABR3WBK0_9PEZI